MSCGRTERGPGREPAVELPRRLSRHLARSGLVRPEDRVLVAVSGGLDSVVLLHLLRFHVSPRPAFLAAATFDHGMRPGSDADARWVAGLCRAWDVPLERGRADPPPRTETEARAARYRFLFAAARRIGATRIATAHHADDQAETVLFRIARGTGLRGLAGIPARRGRIVRPLLPFRRAELAAYARAAGLRHREDPTNRSRAHARNRIRHELLPALERIAPGATEALLRLARDARAAERAWQRALAAVRRDVVVQAGETTELARPRLLAYDPYVRARLLRSLLRRYGSHPDRAGTRAALQFINHSQSGGRFDVAGGVCLEREFDRVRIRPMPRRAESAPADRPVVVPGPAAGSAEAEIGGRVVRAVWGVAPGAAETCGEAFDPAALRFPLVLRGWRPGDRVRLAAGTKKLKKLFVERRVGRTARARVPVLADAAGAIVWVAGLARAAGAEPAAGRPVFWIRVEDAGA